MSTTMFLAAQGAQQPSMMPTLIMIIALFVIMWLFMIRPQQQRQKKIREFQNSLDQGTKIITGGGVHGVVKRIDLAANVVEVEVANGVVIRVDRNYVFADAADTAMAAGQK